MRNNLEKCHKGNFFLFISTIKHIQLNTKLILDAKKKNRKKNIQNRTIKCRIDTLIKLQIQPPG